MAWPVFTRRRALGTIVAAPIALGVLVDSDAVAEDISSTTSRSPLAEFGGGPEIADNTAALRAAVAVLAARGIGVLDLGTGIYRFASTSLGPRGIALPSNITVRGTGRSTTKLRITGSAACNFFSAADKSNLAFEELTLVGNSNTGTGSPYGVGEAIRWYMTNAATADLVGFRLTNVHLENFRGAWWVDIEHGASAQPLLSMREVTIESVTFSSFAGNSAEPSLVTHNAAVFGLNGFHGAIRNIRVNRLSGDATHIKSAIILYHHVIDAILDNVNVRAAGLSGATDDGGAYAIQLYDSYYKMSSIKISNALINAPRSVGIYVAGGSGIVIVNAVVSGQTDTRAGTLPKGAIVLNGTRDWQLIGGHLHDNWCDIGISPPASGTQAQPTPVRGRVEGVRAEGSQEGIAIGYFAGAVSTDIVVRNCQWRTRGRTVSVQNSADPIVTGITPSGGYLNGITFEDCVFEASKGFRAIDLWNGSGSPAGSYVLSRCRLVGSNPLYAKDQTGSLRIEGCDIRDLGADPDASAATLIGCPQLDLRDCTLHAPGRNGIGINLAGSAGAVRGLRFVGCTRNLPSQPAVQLGSDRPRFAGRKGQYVQNLTLASGATTGWLCEGGRIWREAWAP